MSLHAPPPFPPAFTRWAFWIDGGGVGQCDERYWGHRVPRVELLGKQASASQTDPPNII